MDTKNLSNISELDKQDLFLIYIDAIDPPTTWIKGTTKDFNNILKMRVDLMPYCLVLALIDKGYITID
jgi:hypothetical protein